MPPQSRSSLQFEHVYSQHFAFVWRNLRRLGVLESELRDAAQEVFLVVHRRLPAFEGSAAIQAWLYSIARRVAADTRRARRRKPLAESERLDAIADTVSGGPEHNTAQRQAMRKLHELLAELDPEKREMLILVDLEDFSVPEAAALVNANLNTAYSRLRAARLAMRELYATRRGERARRA